MTKYSEQFKLSVVQQYSKGTAGYTTVAQQHGLSPSLVQRWTSLYRMHGVDGLKKKFSHYPADFRMSVLQHMWDHELSYAQATTLFNIRGPGLIGQWERDFRGGGFDALIPHTRGRPKPMTSPPIKPDSTAPNAGRTRKELEAELDHLRMENAYLKKLHALIQAQQKAPSPKKRK